MVLMTGWVYGIVLNVYINNDDPLGPFEPNTHSNRITMNIGMVHVTSTLHLCELSTDATSDVKTSF